MRSYGKNKHKPSSKRTRKIESPDKDQTSDDDFELDNGFPPSKNSKLAVDKYPKQSEKVSIPKNLNSKEVQKSLKKKKNSKEDIAVVTEKVPKTKKISLKKFKCEICEKTYAMADTLKIHIKLDHESKNQKEKKSQYPISNPQNQSSRYLKLYCTGKSFCQCKICQLPFDEDYDSNDSINDSDVSIDSRLLKLYCSGKSFCKCKICQLPLDEEYDSDDDSVENSGENSDVNSDNDPDENADDNSDENTEDDSDLVADDQ